jgi:murein tripeptide amidase MpaA
MVRSLLSACIALVPFALAASTASAAPPDYHGDRVVRLVPTDLRMLRTALAMADDVWSHGAAVGRSLEILVDQQSFDGLVRAGVPFEVMIEDVGGLVAAERKRLADAAANEGGIAGGDAWFAEFKTFAQIDAKLDELVAARPDLCSIVVVGQSVEGRTIRGIRISAAPAGAPAIVFNACQHAREWVSPMTVMYVADRLVADAAVDPATQMLLQQAEIFVIPVVNPDGYIYSWDVDRFWRKNRRNNGNGTFGVDLNRNWGFQWGGPGASASSSSDTYRGPFPFSEPETQAMRDFFSARPQIVSHIDFHSFSQLVLSPWGWTEAPAPDDLYLRSMAERMADAIFSVHQVPYVSGPIASTLYVASGNAVDWAYGARGVFSYTIELRDTGTFGFVLPPDQILPTAEENYAAAFELASASVRPIAVLFPQGIPEVVPTGTFDVPISVTPVAGEPSAAGAILWWRDEPNEPFSAALIAPPTATGGFWSASLPAPVCGRTLEWYVAFETNLGTAVEPLGAPTNVFSTDVRENETSFDDDFETATGWTVGAPGDNATSGQWVRVDPNGTSAQPENDADADGTFCFVTGQGPVGGAAGAADVDGGTTTLVSPILDCSDPESYIQYARWYSNNLGGSPNADSMPIEISSNGGATWTQLELVVENANAWVVRTFRVADFTQPTANTRIRFVARDLGAGSLVEAGVDAVRVFALGCPATLGDLDGDGIVGAADLGILLGAWGGPGPADLDGSGAVDAGDLAVLLGAWS